MAAKKPTPPKEQPAIAVSHKTLDDWQNILNALDFATSNMPFKISEDGSTSNKETLARLARETFRQLPIPGSPPER